MSSLIARIERELSAPDPAQGPPWPRWPRHVLAAAVTLLTPLLLAEILLRVVWAPPPRVLPAGRTATAAAAAESLNRRFGTDAFEPDARRLWRLRAGANLDGLTVSSRGLLGAAEPPFGPASRRSNGLRILVLGDSVPALSYRTFPVLVQRLARAVPEVPELIVVNAAVPGYSSEQGLVWLEQLRDLRPDVVVASFGLADRSPALNLPDRDLLSGTGATAGLVRRLFGGLRAVQWLTASDSERWRRNPATLRKPGEPRVSADRFEENLVALTALARQLGAIPVLATEPGRGQTALAAEPYNAGARRAAEAAGAALLDLDEEFLRRDRDRLLDSDGFHLTAAGHNLVARLLISLLRDRGLLEADAVESIAAAARYDTSAPDQIAAEWELYPSHIDTTTSAPSVPVSVLVRNAGNTRWLRDHIIPQFGDRRDFDYGGVAIIARWRTAGASDTTTAPAARVRLPHDILPGESTSVTLTLEPPRRPGTWAVEIALTTDGHGPLIRYGADVTTLTLTTRLSD